MTAVLGAVTSWFRAHAQGTGAGEPGGNSCFPRCPGVVRGGSCCLGDPAGRSEQQETGVPTVQSRHRYMDIAGTVQLPGDRQGPCSSQNRGCCWDGVPAESGWDTWGLRALTGTFAELVW